VTSDYLQALMFKLIQKMNAFVFIADSCHMMFCILSPQDFAYISHVVLF